MILHVAYQNPVECPKMTVTKTKANIIIVLEFRYNLFDEHHYVKTNSLLIKLLVNVCEQRDILKSQV